MAMNEENMAEKLKERLQNAVAPAAKETENFTAEAASTTEGGVKKGLTEEEKKKRAEARLKKGNMVASMRTKSASKVTPEERKLREAISEKAYIAGYITKRGPRIDFSSSKVTDKDTKSVQYKISLKQFGPTAIQYAIVMVPELLIGLIGKHKEPDFAEKLATYKAQTMETTAYHAELIPWSEMAAWVSNNTNGYIYESSELFTPYVAKGKTINTLADATAHGVVPGGSCLYLAPKFSAKSNNNGERENAMVLKHSFRAKVLTPNNYVAMQTYIDMPIAKSYTEEEAAKMIRLYLDKFTKVPKGGTSPKVSNLIAESAKYITVTPEGKITATSYFPTGANASYFSDNKIQHWSNKVLMKDSNGDASVVPAVLDTPVISQKEEAEKTVDGVKTTYSKFVFNTLGAADSNKEYKFDEVTFPAVIKATNKNLSFRQIEDTLAKSSVARKSKKSGVNTVIAPSDLIGLTSDDVFDIITRG